MEYLLSDMENALMNLEGCGLFGLWVLFLAWIVVFRGNGCKKYKKLPIWLQEMTLRENLVFTFPVTFAFFYIFAGIIIMTSEIQAKAAFSVLEWLHVDLNAMPHWFYRLAKW